MRLFETINMFGVAMVLQMKEPLSLYNLLNKIMAYVKDEGGNLSTLIWVFTYVVSCGPLALLVP
jgi:hypothetical protein